MLDGQGRHRRTTIALAACAAVLTLGACGGSGEAAEAGSSTLAAKVDGQEYTVGEVQTASKELSEYATAQAESSGQQAQQIAPKAMVSSLVQVPAILEYGRENGLEIPSTGSVERDLAPVVPAPSEATVDFFKASHVYTQLDEEGQREIADRINDSDLTISPRYDDAMGTAPNWLEETEPQMEMPGQ